MKHYMHAAIRTDSGQDFIDTDTIALTNELCHELTEREFVLYPEFCKDFPLVRIERIMLTNEF